MSCVIRTVILVLGWAFFAYLVNGARNADPDTKVYNPYDILGVSPVRVQCHPRDIQGIHSIFLGCNRKGNKIIVQKTVQNLVRIAKQSTSPTSADTSISHPDKVKATVNETMEQIANRFVDITKAYKS